MSLTESVFLASLWFLAGGVLCLCAFVAYVWRRTNIPRDEWDSSYPGDA